MVAKRRRTELARARKAAGFTQEELAERLHVDRSTVIRWEAGAHEPWPYLWPKLARLLGVSRDQLKALLASPQPAVVAALAHPTLPNVAVALDDMKRRTLMQWSMVSAAAATVGLSGKGTNVGLADVERLQRSAARLHSLDQQHGGDSLWQAAAAHARDGLQLLEYGTYTDAVGRALLTATGQLHICAGWLALDAGQHDVARSCFTDALAMSHQANDAQTETRALANLAYQANLSARPREALRYAAGAEQTARGKAAMPWLAAFPQLRMAIGGSLSGDARAADQAIAQARRVLERENDAEPEAWSSFLSPVEIDGIEGTCALNLGQSLRAERLLEQTIAGYAAKLARNMAAWRVRLAQARLDLGAVDGAAIAAHTALDDLEEQVASWRVSTELSAVANRLAAYREVDGVDHFFVRYHAMSH